MSEKFPKTMFHASLPPKRVYSPDELKKLGPGWYSSYIPQDYPRILYRQDGQQCSVLDEEEEKAKAAQGYGRTVYQTKTPTEPRTRLGSPQFELDQQVFESFARIDAMELEITTLSEQQAALVAAVNDLSAKLDRMNEPVTEQPEMPEMAHRGPGRPRKQE